MRVNDACPTPDDYQEHRRGVDIEVGDMSPEPYPDDGPVVIDPDRFPVAESNLVLWLSGAG